MMTPPQFEQLIAEAIGIIRHDDAHPDTSTGMNFGHALMLAETQHHTRCRQRGLMVEVTDFDRTEALRRIREWSDNGRW